MTREELIEKFKIAKQEKLAVAIELTVPGSEYSEIIITRYENLDYKLNYYLEAYNDSLELERCKDIKILSVKTVDYRL